ncbi:MAG: DUF2938 family protein [Burkholderiaceae bacterium]
MDTTIVMGVIGSGVAATLALDLWQRLVFRLGGYPASNWAMVGRWLVVLLRRGVIFNDRLTKTDPVEREAAIGWTLHYLVGIGYALLYWALWQVACMIQPTWGHGALFGVISVVVPWFFFMPAMGAGLLARHAPNPSLTCAFALAGHTVFGTVLGGVMGAISASV